jgi:sugar phosphate isomerase/epimerase
MTRLSLGAFYNPHLDESILAIGDHIGHLALADSPHPGDCWWPQIHHRFTLLAHDYLGQLSEAFTVAQLNRARDLVNRYRSPWAAEHLQRIHPTRDADIDTPDVSLDYVFPPLYTEDLLADYVHNAHVLQDYLKVPLAIEPIPTYLQVDLPQLSEAEFLHRLCEQSGCLLLLDIPHAMLSAQTYGRQVASFLLELPLHRVIEIHVAGLAFNADLQSPWIVPVLPDKEILDLAELAAAHAPQLRAITFDAFSPTLHADTLIAGMRLLRERFI